MPKHLLLLLLLAIPGYSQAQKQNFAFSVGTSPPPDFQTPVEQQTPAYGIACGGEGQNGCGMEMWDACPDGCTVNPSAWPEPSPPLVIWDADDGIQYFGKGDLAGGDSVQLVQPIYADHHHHGLAVMFGRQGGGKIDVVVEVHLQLDGKDMLPPLVQNIAVSKDIQSICLLSPSYGSFAPTLPEVYGSGYKGANGRAQLVTILVRVVNRDVRTARSVSVGAYFGHPAAIGPRCPHGKEPTAEYDGPMQENGLPLWHIHYDVEDGGGFRP